MIEKNCGWGHKNYFPGEEKPFSTLGQIKVTLEEVDISVSKSRENRDGLPD